MKMNPTVTMEIAAKSEGEDRAQSYDASYLPCYVLYYLVIEERVLVCKFQLVYLSNNVTCAYERSMYQLST
jgi:hypothetical protein